MNCLRLKVWSSRARLTSDQMSFCFARRLHPQFVSILEQIFLGPLSCPRKLRLVQVPIFPPLSSSLRFPKVARQHRLKIHFEKNSCQNLSQKMFTFFQWISTFQSIYQIYAFFGPLFFVAESPLLVPISLKIRSPFWKIEVPFPCGSGDIDIECILVYCFYIFVFSYCCICPLLAGAHDARHSLPRFPHLLFCKECLPIVCARHNGGDNNVVICCWMLLLYSRILFLYFCIFILMYFVFLFLYLFVLSPNFFVFLDFFVLFVHM